MCIRDRGDTAPRVYEVKNAVGITLAAQLGRPELAGPGFNLSLIHISEPTRPY